MTPRRISLRRSVNSCMVLMTLVIIIVPAAAQQTNPAESNSDLAQSIQELREQVHELRAAVAEIKSEAAQYRAENQELRNQLQSIRGSAGSGTQATASAAQNHEENGSVEQRVSGVEESTQVLQSEVRTLYQSKVESASHYRVRLSGVVLLNLFRDHGQVDNLDVPSYATPSGSYGIASTFGATLRQSEFGLEAFGPELAGAKTSAEVHVDFGGGFPGGELNGVNTGIVRLRTADARLDWENTSLVAGQDSLFISPNSPTSFASLLVPSMGYSGNLWAWTPQLRIEHRFNFADDESISLQGGILDNLTGEALYGANRLPQAGENSGQPAYAARASWTKIVDGKPLTIGASGYYSRQNWGYGWIDDGWAGATDWRLPLAERLELSGEFYRGEAVGGLGGGIGQSVLFSKNPTSPHSDFLPLNSTGGWSQLKFAATSKLEFNGAFGVDNPFAADIHALRAPVGIYSSVLTANRSQMLNFVFHPRSDLLFSGEYRHLRTSQIGTAYSADQANLMMGVLF